jgi:hypothetical protein
LEAFSSIDLKKRESNKNRIKMFTHSKEKMVKRGKTKCPPQVMCGVDIKFLLNAIFY